ncbi:hypothetical protein FRC00_014362 [Tulasnella sp. 408]|nr:hypothetical protein FRC00_014362 [Tulasnella sp. 408]
MLRQKSEAELYLYISQGVNQNDNKCDKKAKSKCPSTGYANSVGRGTWNWTPGKWMTIVQRLKPNTPGAVDGEAELFIDGKSVLNVGGMMHPLEDHEGLRAYLCGISRAKGSGPVL